MGTAVAKKAGSKTFAAVKKAGSKGSDVIKAATKKAVSMTKKTRDAIRQTVALESMVAASEAARLKEEEKKPMCYEEACNTVWNCLFCKEASHGDEPFCRTCMKIRPGREKMTWEEEEMYKDQLAQHDPHSFIDDGVERYNKAEVVFHTEAKHVLGFCVHTKRKGAKLEMWRDGKHDSHVERFELELATSKMKWHGTTATKPHKPTLGVFTIDPRDRQYNILHLKHVCDYAEVPLELRKCDSPADPWTEDDLARLQQPPQRPERAQVTVGEQAKKKDGSRAAPIEDCVEEVKLHSYVENGGVGHRGVGAPKKVRRPQQAQGPEGAGGEEVAEGEAQDVTTAQAASPSAGKEVEAGNTAAAGKAALQSEGVGQVPGPDSGAGFKVVESAAKAKAKAGARKGSRSPSPAPGARPAGRKKTGTK
uniref:Uncharacterized protein n=1 Tax=Oxyrrhis marina TaxID=2969 RepID=A0A7S4GQA6_OXYMA